MRTVRASLGLLGVVALGVAVGTVLVPGLAGSLDVGAVAGNDYLFVVPLGLGAAVVLLGAVASRSKRGVDQVTPPDAEGVPTADAPGAGFDRIVGRGWLTAPAALRERDRLDERLRAVATRTIAQAERCSRDAARRRLEAGTWTDDPEAAAYFAREPVDGRTAAATAVRALRHLELPLQRRARRAALAIDRIDREGRS